MHNTAAETECCIRKFQDIEMPDSFTAWAA